jgi:hypothetical protein
MESRPYFATLTDRGGGLSAIKVINHSGPATPTDIRKIHHSRWIPGLRRLYLVAVSGWQAGQEGPSQTVLVDLAGVEDCDPQTLQTLWNKGS